MSQELLAQIAALPGDLRAALKDNGFDAQRLARLATRFATGSMDDNRVAGSVTEPAPHDVADLPAPGDPEHARLERLGAEALGAGQVAMVVLAGGMATRMGGVVKALVEAVPGKTFLDLRLAEMDAIERDFGARAPLWLMTSRATDAEIRRTLGSRADGRAIATFRQHVSLRLTPSGSLFLDESGQPSDHATGHGDLPDALRESGLLAPFVDGGGRVVMVANLDNLGATLDPVVVGFHLDHGRPASCEVVDKVGSDRGGIPVRWDGRPVVLEEFRLPEDFDPARVSVFNTNTFHFGAAELLNLTMDWTFFSVKKQVDESAVIQFERLIGEVTSHLETRFLRVPRDGARSRFLPVKDNDELARRRPEIEAVARARGMLA